MEPDIHAEVDAELLWHAVGYTCILDGGSALDNDELSKLPGLDHFHRSPAESLIFILIFERFVLVCFIMGLLCFHQGFKQLVVSYSLCLEVFHVEVELESLLRNFSIFKRLFRSNLNGLDFRSLGINNRCLYIRHGLTKCYRQSPELLAVFHLFFTLHNFRLLKHAVWQDVKVGVRAVSWISHRFNRHLSGVEDKCFDLCCFFCPPSPLFSLEEKHVEFALRRSRFFGFFEEIGTITSWSLASGSAGTTGSWFATFAAFGLLWFLHLRAFEHKVIFFLAEVMQPQPPEVEPAWNLELDVAVEVALIVENQVSSSVRGHDSVGTNECKEVVVVLFLDREALDEAQVSFRLHHYAVFAEEIFLRLRLSCNDFFVGVLVGLNVVYETTSVSMFRSLKLIVVFQHHIDRSPGRVILRFARKQRNGSIVPV